MRERWPLVGRDVELEYAAGLASGGRGVVVAGGLGVGKTRLLEEVATGLERDGWHVERVVGTPSSRELPLLAFAFLERLADADSAGAGVPLAAARRELIERAAGRTLALVVDDAQHLDEASAVLVHQLASNRDAVVLAGVRVPSHVPDAVVALWKDDRCAYVELQPLARHEVETLVETVLGAPVDGATRAALWDASQGNLLFLRELVRDGLRRATLRCDGLWRWERDGALPASVRELAGRQVGALDEAARRALELVSLAEPLEWTALERAVGRPVLEPLVDDGHLEMRTDRRRRVAVFSHPLVGDVVRARMTPVRRTERLVELVTMLDARGRRRADALRRVTWLVDAGGEVGTAELLEAAERLTLLDATRAEHFARLAHEREPTIVSAITLARILMFRRRAAEADELLAGMRPESVEDEVEIAVNRANTLTFGCSRPQDAVVVLDRVLPRVHGDRQRRFVRSHRLASLFFAGNVRDVLDEAARLVADEQATPADRLRAALTLVPALAASGEPARAIGRAEAARPLVREAAGELPYALGQLAAGTILALQWAGRLDDAQALAQFGYDTGQHDHAALLLAVSAFHLGLTCYWRGALRDAERFLTEAAAGLREHDVGFLPSALDHLVAVRALLGAPPGAADATLVRFPLYETERLRLAGVIAAASGDVGAARDFDRLAAEEARAHGITMHELLACWDGARHGAPDPTRVAAIASRCDGALAPVLAAATRALARNEGHALSDAAEALASLGFTLWAAELARAASRAFAEEGLRARAAGAGAWGDALLARCDDARTPLSARLGAETAALTRREREVAELAARGAPNADIGARLGISVRTVETHLQRVYAKVGISRRDDLAAALGLRSDVSSQ